MLCGMITHMAQLSNLVRTELEELFQLVRIYICAQITTLDEAFTEIVVPTD